MENWIDLYYEKEQSIDWIRDRIQPFMEVKVGNEWLSYPLGVFLLSSPLRTEEGFGVTREVEAFDELTILTDDKFDERYTVEAGTRYHIAVIRILIEAGIRKYNIQDSPKSIPSDMEWSIGTEKIRAINDILAAINYTPLWVDEYGYFTSSRYSSPQDRSPDHVYMDDETSVTFNGMNEEIDYMTPNKWVAVYSNPDTTNDEESASVLSAVYTNEDLDDPNSIWNTYTKVDFREVTDIADQEELNEYVRRLAIEASQIYRKVKFKTALMPGHSYQDVLFLRNKNLGLEGKYSETSWEMELKAGGSMDHEVRKVVVLNE